MQGDVLLSLFCFFTAPTVASNRRASQLLEEMDVTSPGGDSNILEGGATKSQTETITSQPAANGLRCGGQDKPQLTASDRSEESGDDSLTDGGSTNDVTRLLPHQPASSSAQRKQRGADSSTSPPLVCTPPTASSLLPASAVPESPSSPPSRTSTSNRNTCSRHQHSHSAKQKRLSSTKSHSSLRTDAAHIKEVAGEDCCVHCLLACLFCEMLSMCSAMGDCLACGVGGAACCDGPAACCCCCVEAAGEAACTEEACQAVLDCGIMEDCCASSDCLEICLECCSICFPT